MFPLHKKVHDLNHLSKPITKALFPVAGLGTRFLPVTKASPKEMLPVLNKPLIQYAVEEAYAAGIREMIFITRQNKASIGDHFDRSLELEQNLITANKLELLNIIKEVAPHDMECVYIRQPEPRGLGHAVYMARHLIGDEYFALLLADDLMVSETPVLQQMVTQHQLTGGNIIAIEAVPKALISMYGVAEGKWRDDKLLKIERLIEKPPSTEVQSNFAVIGRYILSSKIFELIQMLPQENNQEIQLTDAMDNLLISESIYGYLFKGERYDCGSQLGFLKANVVLGLQNDGYGDIFHKWLGHLVEDK